MPTAAKKPPRLLGARFRMSAWYTGPCNDNGYCNCTYGSDFRFHAAIHFSEVAAEVAAEVVAEVSSLSDSGGLPADVRAGKGPRRRRSRQLAEDA